MKKFLYILVIIWFASLSPYITFAEDTSTGSTVGSLVTPAFSDIDVNSFYQIPLKFLKDRKIIQGYDDGTFRPGNKVSRAEALKIIFLGTQKDIDINDLSWDDNKFPDVESGSWYVPYVHFAKDQKIVEGYKDGYFRPGKEITLVETLKILSLTKDLQYPQDGEVKINYSDIDMKEWYGKYIAYAVQNNLLRPSRSDKLFPDDPMTRGEIAEFLYKFILSTESGKPYSYTSSGIASYYGAAFDGRNTASGDVFDKDGYSAAHSTLPLGTYISVADADDPTKTILVKVNDRGAFTELGREIDLSQQAFASLDALSKGLNDVKIEEVAYAPNAVKKIYKVNEDLPVYFDSIVELPSLFQVDELFSLKLNPKEPLNIAFKDASDAILYSTSIASGTTKDIGLYFQNQGAYSLSIGEKTYSLYVFDRFSTRDQYTPDISTNNYEFVMKKYSGDYEFSWIDDSSDKIYLISVLSSDNIVLKDIIIQNINKFTLPAGLFSNIHGEVKTVLSYRSKFTGFSVDKSDNWQPIAKTTGVYD